MFDKKMTIGNLGYVGSIAIDSGQAMVGDPCYLDEWQTNKGEEWQPEGKEGQYSYQGASATTIKDNMGQLGNGRAVVFSTGYGDGMYPVYVSLDENNRVAKVVIDFLGDEE